MAIRLFHRTTAEAARVILAGGFRNDPDEPRGVWFSPYLDCWGERGRTLLEVMLDITEAELATYAVEAVADEEWDEAAGDFVPCDAEDVEVFTWYAIPAEVVNARGLVRLVPIEESRRLTEGY